MSMNEYSRRKDLQFPKAEDIEDAYRELPRKGHMNVRCTTDRLASTIDAMENVGLFAIEIAMVSIRNGHAEVRALKGKTGPCYDTGCTASLKIPVAAALDDDNHLITGNYAVCEKTANLYRMNPYSATIVVSPGDPELLARLETDPLSFDCGAKDELGNFIPPFPRASAEPAEIPVLYRGPMRLVVLNDGAILRRGRFSLLSKAQFIAMPGLIRFEQGEVDARPAPYLDEQELLDPTASVSVHQRETGEVDWSSLEGITDDMKIHLLGMIKRDEKYFLLTGSDPNIEGGCCPSADVGEAMHLVQAGILAASNPPQASDACTITVFAFAGEITTETQPITFSTNPEFREQVCTRLLASLS